MHGPEQERLEKMGQDDSRVNTIATRKPREEEARRGARSAKSP